jgi:hypothetical protein
MTKVRVVQITTPEDLEWQAVEPVQLDDERDGGFEDQAL